MFSGFIVFGVTDIKESYAVVSLGESLLWTCETTNFTNAQFHWKFYHIGSTEAEAITLYNGNRINALHSRVNVTNPTQRSSVLSLRDVRLTDAGTYFCNIIDQELIEERYTFSLIVAGEMSINSYIMII